MATASPTNTLDFHAVFGEFSHNDLLAGGGDTFDIPWTSAEQRAFAPTGAFTPSRKASRDKGKQYHDYQVANLVRFITWLRTYEGPIGRVETRAGTVPALADALHLSKQPGGEDGDGGAGGQHEQGQQPVVGGHADDPVERG